MTYAELVKQVKKNVKTLDASAAKQHLAVEFDIIGEAEGAFYVEFSDGKVDVEPFEYYDYDIRIRTDAQTALDLTAGRLSFEKAAADQKVVAEGNTKVLASIGRTVKKDTKKIAKKAEPKKIAKKTEPKKIAKKVEPKKIAKKAEPKKITKK